MYWKYFCCNSSIRITYKWHHSHLSLCINQTGTTQTTGARNKGGNFIGQLCISVVPHWVKDLLQIPHFTEGDIYNYFVLKMSINKSFRAKVYYTDRHVYDIHYCSISDVCDHCFVKCKVIPSITNAKKNPDHDVWLCMSKVRGNFHSADCDCTAE